MMQETICGQELKSMIAFLNGRTTLSSQVAFIVILCATHIRWTLGIINTQDNKQTQQCMLMRHDKRRSIGWKEAVQTVRGSDVAKTQRANSQNLHILNLYEKYVRNVSCFHDSMLDGLV